MNIKQLLVEGGRKLAQATDETGSPRLEAELLLCLALDVSRTFLFAHPEQPVPEARAGAYRALLRRRQQGEPLAYITGQREFWSLDLAVNPDVLIPRPETESLVAWALELLPTTGRAADLGTGSGAIALALASERPGADVHGTDISPAAMETARNNGLALKLANVHFHLGSWAGPLNGSFDLLVSNPPYVAQDDPHLQRGDVRFEPKTALTPGADALAAYAAILLEAPNRLKANGWLLFEHGFEQGEAVRGLMSAAGFRNVETRQDLAGQDRITGGRWPDGRGRGQAPGA